MTEPAQTLFGDAELDAIYQAGQAQIAQVTALAAAITQQFADHGVPLGGVSAGIAAGNAVGYVQRHGLPAECGLALTDGRYVMFVVQVDGSVTDFRVQESV